MTKRQLIDEIVAINHTAPASFLARFDDGELNEYLEHLRLAQGPRPTSDQAHFYTYFRPVNVAVDQPYEAQPAAEPELQGSPLFDMPRDDGIASLPVEPLPLGEKAQDEDETHEAAAAPAEPAGQAFSEPEAEAWLY